MIDAPSYKFSRDCLQAEALVVSTLLHKPDLAAKYGPGLTLDLFEDGVWRAFATHALSAIEAHGECSPPLVAEAVKAEGHLSSAEIAERLAGLADWSVFGEGHTVQALQLLTERKNRRHLCRGLRDAVQEVEAETSTAEILAKLEALAARMRAQTIARLSTLADTLTTDPADERGDAIRTGIEWFDVAMPDGSLQAGDKFAVAGPPGVGKTALGLQLTLGALLTNPDLHVVWAMGEMSDRQLRNRALCSLSELTVGILKRPQEKLSPFQVEKKQEAIETVREIGKRFYFVKAPLTISAIESGILATGARWVVLDYLQLVRPEKPGTSRRDEIDGAIRELTRIAQAHGVILFIISDMAKGSVNGRDVFGAFKESSEIPYAADMAYVGGSP